MFSRHSVSNDASQKRQLARSLAARIGEDRMKTVGTLDDLKREYGRLKLSDDMSVADSKYDCVTQVSMPEPLRHHEHHQKDEPAPEEVWMGPWGEIPRWKRGSTINYTAYLRGYLHPSHAYYAAHQLVQAAERWNKMDIGIQFKWVDKLDDAAFALAYGADGGSTLCKGFFPNSRDLNTLFVYQRAFKAGFVNNMENMFLHELGHILGLRHEFANQLNDRMPWGSSNPYSVMSYSFPQQIQDSDVKDTKAFYDFSNDRLGPYRIVDITPEN
ncbi:Peptidase M10 metallopeptidase [Macrophomina phaseolina MS6]|uniref:Peptidase M10 metallopeptidase n=2 Tax=Macrophomina phaseolina TaxID=35725 RepID=K2RR99_MACPH|nr:Peptidase M10 metallopeptidase [Macrophomina phaseolina MS6]KAH7015955.1 hypothetical protein B0J12DRAFT_689128 [Macrophomina phaseolina]